MKQLPEQIKLPELGKAMATLEEFSEKDADYYRYLAQEDALHVEATWKHANASLEQKPGSCSGEGATSSNKRKRSCRKGATSDC